MKTKLNKLALCAAIAGCVAIPMTASATNGILAYGNGMVSHGVGGAGVANASEIMSALDNPALAANVGPGWSVGASAFNPNRAANVGRGYVDSESEWFLIPSGGWFTGIGDNAVAGITVSALGGMNTDYPSQLFGTRVGIDLAGIIIAPTYAAKVSDTVSIGAALLIGVETLESTGPGVGGLPRNEKETVSGLGLEVGIAIQASESTTIGIDYQSKIDMDEFEEHGKFLFAAASNKQLTLPAIITVGVTHQINDQWKISADVSDVPWSDIDLISELFGWEDQTVYKIGAEMQVNDELAIRFGYNQGDSPITDAHAGQGILAPAVTEDHITIGFSKKMGKGTLTGYYARVPSVEKAQLGAPGGFPKIKMDQNAFGIGYDVSL